MKTPSPYLVPDSLHASPSFDKLSEGVKRRYRNIAVNRLAASIHLQDEARRLSAGKPASPVKPKASALDSKGRVKSPFLRMGTKEMELRRQIIAEEKAKDAAAKKSKAKPGKGTLFSIGKKPTKSFLKGAK